MNRLQRFFTSVFPSSWAASMEAESRQWRVRCQSCGFEQSVWDMGGIRWKASGTKWTWGRCSNCGKRTWYKIYRRDSANPPIETETGDVF